MDTLAASSPAPPAHLSLRAKAVLAALVLVPFTAFTLWAMATHGPLGFLALARDDVWGLQLLLDLGISASFGLGWVVNDARKRGIAAWPFIAATVIAGSIGLLSYLAYRGLTPRRAA